MNMWIICLSLLFCALYTSEASDRYQPIKIAYKVYVPADGVDKSLCPIILLHGLLATKESWDDIAPLIAEKTRRKIYAYDTRNHGDSEFTEEASLELALDDHFHFMDVMNIQKAVLIGHSMGGYIAAQVAVTKPERVESVFSIDMHLRKLSDEKLSLIKQFIRGWAMAARYVPSDLDDRAAVKYLLDIIFYFAPSGSPIQKEKSSLYKTKFVLKRTESGSWAPSFNKDVVLSSLSNPDDFMKEPKGQFMGPTYFLYAGLSGFGVGDEEDYIKRYFPNAEMVEFPLSYHNIPAEFPEKFLEEVVQRLKLTHSA